MSKKKQTATAKATATSIQKKYILSCVFETSEEAQATEAFQFAICEFEKYLRIKIAHLQYVDTSAPNSPERPVLERIQILRPEDFSSWDRNCEDCQNGVQHTHCICTTVHVNENCKTKVHADVVERTDITQQEFTAKKAGRK